MPLRIEGTYYARTEHGGYQVVADQQGFLVSWPSGPIRYPSVRQTLIALTNQSPTPQPNYRDPKLSFNRYFRRGRFAEPSLYCDTLVLFSPKLTVAAAPVLIKSSPHLSVEAPQGIDLSKRGHEVRKLFYAGYGRKVVKYGYDPEDVLQEIYKGILVRNQGKCPFDPSKSSFGHYVHMICGCIVSNYRRRYSRLEKNEQFGVPTMEDGEMQDVRESDLAIVDPEQQDLMELNSHWSFLNRLVEKSGASESDRILANQCLVLMEQGYRKGEIARKVGESPDRVSKVLKTIREAANEWRTHVDP